MAESDPGARRGRLSCRGRRSARLQRFLEAARDRCLSPSRAGQRRRRRDRADRRRALRRRRSRLGRRRGLAYGNALSRVGEPADHPQLAASRGLSARDAPLRAAEMARQVPAFFPAALAPRVPDAPLPLRDPPPLPALIQTMLYDARAES